MAPPESPLTMDPCVAHVCQTNHMWSAMMMMMMTMMMMVMTMEPCVAHVCYTNHMWSNPCIINSNNSTTVIVTLFGAYGLLQ